MTQWHDRITGFFLRRLTRPDKGLRIAHNYNQVGFESPTQPLQQVDGYSNSRRQFADHEAFVDFCSELDRIGNLTGFTLNGQNHATGELAARWLLGEPVESMHTLHFQGPNSLSLIMTSTDRRDGYGLPVRYSVIHRPQFQESFDSSSTRLDEALTKYTIRAPLAQSWNRFEPYPLVRNTPRLEVAQQNFMRKTERRAAMYGGLVGGAASLLVWFLEFMSRPH